MCALPYILDSLSKYFWGVAESPALFWGVGALLVWCWCGDSGSGVPSLSDFVVG